MNSHLTSEQIEYALKAQPSQEASQHLDSCVQCSDELALLRQAFESFRETATAAAAHHRRFVATSGSRRVPRMAWGLAATALFVSIAAPLAVHRHAASVVGGEAPRISETMSDEALLNSVQDDLSSSVPASLLPLAGTSTGSATSKNSKTH